MNNKYDLVIGIEIHVQSKTNSKMFSPSKTSYKDIPNINVNNIDLGFPGSKPIVNKEAVKLAVKLAYALKMDIPKKTSFDRKHYFYQDLPKGFQITQFYYPIGKNGILKLSNGKEVKITQIHMEEDTAKQIHNEGTSFIDYNRSGIPLIEIVTDHTTITTIEDAVLFVKTLRGLLLYHNISNAKMNEGSMRCDVNISLKPKGSKILGNKVEIKNINSIANIKTAIAKELEHQTKALNKSKNIVQATKRFDDNVMDVILMREKSSSTDYLYFRETNIPSILITNKDIDAINKGIMPFEYFVNNLSEKLNIKFDKVLDFINKSTFPLFSKVMNEKIDIKVAYNLFESVIASVLNKLDNIPKINKDDLIKLINARSKKELSQTQVEKLFEKLTLTKKVDIDKEISKINSSKIDAKDVENILDKIMSNNKEMVSQYNERPERVEKFLMGQLMKETKGNINPSDSVSLIKKKMRKE